MKMDQGSIIFGVKSSFYPEYPCYGIIITASCDVANCKVPRFYYVVALDAKNWLRTEKGFIHACADIINKSDNKLMSLANQHHLSTDVLKGFSDEEIDTVLMRQIKKEKSREEFKSLFKENVHLHKPGLTEHQKDKIISKNLTIVSKYLNEINQGKNTGFYYLPQKAYNKNEVLDDGMIVDLQEIQALSIEDAELIESSGIDMRDLPKDCEERGLKERYWLKADDDYVALLDQIESPWREHLMQRFSYAFTRIGLNGARLEHFEKLLENI